MNINKYLNLLLASDLFNAFSEKDLKELFEAGQYHISKYDRGSMIHTVGQQCVSWDIILKGHVIIQQIDEKGDVLTVTGFSMGDDIGGNLLFSEYTSFPMSVTAKSDAVILHIDRELVLELCQYNKDFLIEFLKCISNKTAILTSKIKKISMKSIRELIIDFLNYEYHVQKNKTIKLHLSKKELAEQMGVQRTSLSRELNKMEKDDLISYNAQSIIIKNFRIIKDSPQ